MLRACNFALPFTTQREYVTYPIMVQSTTLFVIPCGVAMLAGVIGIESGLRRWEHFQSSHNENNQKPVLPLTGLI